MGVYFRFRSPLKRSKLYCRLQGETLTEKRIRRCFYSTVILTCLILDRKKLRF